jgi:hypothetical protein
MKKKTLFVEILFFTGLSIVLTHLPIELVSNNWHEFPWQWLLISFVALGFIHDRYRDGYYKIFWKRNLLKPGVVFLVIDCLILASSLLAVINS